MKIAVIGVGTAGCLSLCHMLTYLPSHWEVVSIHDPSTPIVGIGESTLPRFPFILFAGTRFHYATDKEYLDATVKQGVKFVNWREDEIFHTFASNTYGIHFNTNKLKDFVLSRLPLLWKNRFSSLVGNVEDAINTDNGVDVIVDGVVHEFDYVIDCRGFPHNYDDCQDSNVVPVNHALINIIDKPGEWDWTYHYAHPNGWMFGIPLSSRQGWGYLYNDTISTKEDGLEWLSDHFKTPVADLNIREYSWRPFFSNKMIDGRIIKNGNRLSFMEPLQALSFGIYDAANLATVEFVQGRETEERAEIFYREIIETTEATIAFHYHGGSVFDTDFWKMASVKCSQYVSSVKNMTNLFDRLREYRNSSENNLFMYIMSPQERESLKMGIFDPQSIYFIDESFGYNYTKDSWHENYYYIK
jgi:hypothetical protein